MRLLAFAAMLCCAGAASAATITLQLDGVEDGPLRDAAVAASGIAAYAHRQVSDAQAQRLYAQAPAAIAAALEPFGYFQVAADGELRHAANDYVAVLHVRLGEPTRVASLDIDLPAQARQQPAVARAVAAFTPARGAVLDQPAYEQSKHALQAALVASGYLDAHLRTHVVQVTRADNRAAITLAWDTGTRYRYGATTFSGSQFADGFLARYVPWQEGDYYAQAQLLQLQQALIDADYFAVVDIEPDLANAHDGVVPILVSLGAAKRNVYSAGIFVDSDIGAGVKGAWTRRWTNRHGHKARVEAEIAQRESLFTGTYTIPLAGANEHKLNFGAAYRNIDTRTVVSNTTRLTVNETSLWHGWLRTYALNALSGSYTVANIDGNSSVLYPEFSLTRRHMDDERFVRDGWSLSLDAKAGPGPSTRFAALRADGTWIRGFGASERLVLRGSLGAMQVADFDKLPPELRFFAGGDRSIRGYPYETIGPPLPAELLPLARERCASGRTRTDCNTLIIGGTRLAVGSAELQHFFTPTLGIAAFVDAGDAFSASQRFRAHVGAGLGVLWRSPVGMLRAYLGTPVNDPDGLHGVQLHLIIGPDL